MSRLDWRRGRFTVDYETNELHYGIRGYQTVHGQEVEYYRFESESSVMHDIYDEGYAVGKVYHGPVPIPVIQAIHQEGPDENTDTGFYYNDNLHVTCSFSQLDRLGLTRLDIETQTYLMDRIVYDEKVFKVSNMSILGQIQKRDIIVSIEAAQVRDDELILDTQFAKYADRRVAGNAFGLGEFGDGPFGGGHV